MGHNIRVHSGYYRLPESTLQVAKVGRLLKALEEGHLSTFTGLAILLSTIWVEVKVDVSSNLQRAMISHN
jgi:hypothetical protein